MINNLIDHTNMLTFHQKKPTGWFKNLVKEDKSFVLVLFAQSNQMFNQHPHYAADLFKK